MDLSLARDNRFTPGHSVSLDGINWWPADIHPRTPCDAQALPRHAALEVHVTRVFSLLVVGSGSISLGNNFWAVTLGARTQRQPFGCHSVRYLPEDLQMLEELPGCVTERAHWPEGSVTSIRNGLPVFRAEAWADADVVVAMTPVLLDHVDANTLLPIAVAKDDALLLKTCVNGVGGAVPGIPEMAADVNTSVAASRVAENEVLLTEAAANADVEGHVPSALLVNAISVTIEG